jgi:hypothetical protein
MTSTGLPVTTYPCGNPVPGYEARNPVQDAPNTNYIPNGNEVTHVLTVPVCVTGTFPPDAGEGGPILNPPPPPPNFPPTPPPPPPRPRRPRVTRRRTPPQYVPPEARRRGVGQGPQISGNAFVTRAEYRYNLNSGRGQRFGIQGQPNPSQFLFPSNNPQTVNASLEYNLTQTSNEGSESFPINPAGSQVTQKLPNPLQEECIPTYNQTYNFFKVPSTPVTDLVANQSRLDIFSNQVAEEVKYFLDMQNSTAAWNEKYISNLSIEKISISINSSLYESLNNIHGEGSLKIDFSVFLNTLKSHLLQGTLNEFDPSFFISVAQKQQNDNFYSLSRTQESQATINTSLAIFEGTSINPDYERLNLDKNERNDFRRMRFLPEDLQCKIDVLQIDGTSEPLLVTNNGIPTQQLPALIDDPSVSSIETQFGDGAGYYFSSLSINGEEYPLPTYNELSNSYYLNTRDRALILGLLGADSSLRLTSTSPLNNHEFTSTYNSSADVDLMYFILDMSSVGDIIGTKLMVTTTSANYIRTTSEEAIAHSKNNCLNLSKINVDYRDPFIHYARDSSSVYCEIEDFSVKALNIETTPNSDKLILRSLPQGIILLPGCGSKHNPFNGKSKFQDYSNSAVRRTLSLKPTIDQTDLQIQTTPLAQEKVVLQLGTDSFGLYEKYLDEDLEGLIYSFNASSEEFLNSYYSYPSGFNSTQPPSEFRVNSPESNLLNLTDKLATVALDLKNTSGTQYGFLSWYDIYRRMTLNDIGKLMYTNSQDLISKIEQGFVQGVFVNNTLNDVNTTIYYGIPESATVPNDSIIITEADRINFKNSLK